MRLSEHFRPLALRATLGVATLGLGTCEIQHLTNSKAVATATVRVSGKREPINTQDPNHSLVERARQGDFSAINQIVEAMDDVMTPAEECDDEGGHCDPAILAAEKDLQKRYGTSMDELDLFVRIHHIRNFHIDKRPSIDTAQLALYALIEQKEKGDLFDPDFLEILKIDESTLKNMILHVCMVLKSDEDFKESFSEDCRGLEKDAKAAQ